MKPVSKRDSSDEEDEGSGEVSEVVCILGKVEKKTTQEEKQSKRRENNPSSPDIDPDDPILTTPLVRYNAMLAVLRNTLYM